MAKTASIQKQTRSLRGTRNQDEHFFSAEGTAFNEEEVIGSLLKDLELGYDPHEMTEKIIQFGLALTGIPLYQYQYDTAYRIIYSIVAFEGETLTVLWARQSGKSETMAFIVVTLTVLLPTLAKIIPEFDQWKGGFHIGLFAPQGDQVVTTYNRAMSRLRSANAKMILNDPDIDTDLIYEARYHLSNGSTLTGQTASRNSKIESKTYDLVVCEEAQELNDFMVQKSIEPMVTATGGTIAKVGTTGTHKSDFFHEIQRNSQRSRAAKDPRLKFHFEFDYKEIIRQKRDQYRKDGKRFHLNYENIIAKQIEKRGPHAEVFKLSYALQWELETGMFVTDKDWLTIINRKKGFANSTPNPEDFIVAGLDIAKEHASTILTIVKVDYSKSEVPHKEVLKFIELHAISYAEQLQAIVYYLDHYGVDRLVADYTGVGKPFIDMVVAECGDWVEIIPYNFTRASKSDMWVALLSDIQEGRIEIPANKTARETDEYKNCEDQFKGMLKYYEGSYLVAHKSPGYFDDYPDSLGLAIVAANMPGSESMMSVEILETNPFLPQTNIHGLIKNNSW
jgi:hypothetical protein